jgi:hypothetical protein
MERILPSNQETEMKGLIKKAAAALCLTAGLAAFVGCARYRETVDPCWPERYSYQARGSVRDVHNAQAEKGHILNHSLWNSDFTDEKLNPSGAAKLKYIVHREPTALVQKVYLQNADDADGMRRETLNSLRSKAILAYLQTQRSERSPTHFDVEVHNYQQPTYPAEWTGKALMNVETNIKGGKAQPFITPAVNSGSGGSSGAR